jgi:glycoside/pentoside/hexuronide:cation symporter, GPH family
MTQRPDSPPPAATPDSPSPDDKIPVAAKAAYGFGGVNDIFGHWLYPNVSGPVFTMYLGLEASLVGAVLMIARLFDAFTDPFFGWLSDNTRTRWGRRRPYILFGSVAAGIALPCLFLASRRWDASAPWMHNRLFWFMLTSTFLYAPIISLYNMPYLSLGSELTPNYHERTSVMAFKAIIQKVSGIYLAFAWWFANRPLFNDPSTGKPNVLLGMQWAAAFAGLMMIIAGFANFFCVRERYYVKASQQPRTQFWATLRQTFRSRPFVVLLAIQFVYVVPTTMIGGLSQYVGTYYSFHGDQATMSNYYFYGSIGYFAFGVLGVGAASWIARYHGKRRALLFTLATGILAFGSSWWMYRPGGGWLIVLNTSLTGFCSTGLWVVLPSMCVDVVDDDEIRSGQRREGAFTSWNSWITKTGAALSLGLANFLLTAVGYKQSLGGDQTPQTIWWIRFLFAAIPMAALLVALVLLAFYPLTQSRMAEIRRQLEARRGAV